MRSSEEHMKVLAVEDDAAVSEALVLALEGVCQVQTASSAEDALACLEDSPVDVLLVDIKLPGMDGISLLDEVVKRRPGIKVVMLTGISAVKTVVAAMKKGAYDYLVKPINPDRLLAVLGHIRDELGLRRKVDRLGRRLAEPFDIKRIVGKSPALRRVMDLVRRASANDLNVIVQGETGTGKDLVARAIHHNSHRRHGEFISINCARLAGSLADSELFGHEKGSFTGALATHAGIFERADGGTLFLDELSSLPAEAQAKLLRVVEEHCIQRVGGMATVPTNFRLVSATNRCLRAEVEAGNFREDLYYRLAVMTIDLPPLRERRDDVPLLANHFLSVNGDQTSSPVKVFTPAALEALRRHHWRGNVRELQSMVQFLMTFVSTPTIDVGDLGIPILDVEPTDPTTIRELRAVADRSAVLAALEESGWHKRKAAEKLGVHRNTIRNLMARYGITPPASFSPMSDP
jgi:DNA-binding NtrC family response regulator